MKVLLRAIAVLCVVIGAFLIYAVIHAVASPGGARVPVCIAYVIAAIVLGYVARWLWLRPTRRSRAAGTPSGS